MRPVTLSSPSSRFLLPFYVRAGTAPKSMRRAPLFARYPNANNYNYYYTPRVVGCSSHFHRAGWLSLFCTSGGLLFVRLCWKNTFYLFNPGLAGVGRAAILRCWRWLYQNVLRTEREWKPANTPCSQTHTTLNAIFWRMEMQGMLIWLLLWCSAGRYETRGAIHGVIFISKWRTPAAWI